ncbi:hypothetical protein SBFV2_gp15 [Sulfolobales Beppu filamentous virus 2]|uniref:Uncharacterized protein n=1 Tax=Sulfolobales Beppu filamentous virus 2 TaxID=2493123 RepID=A0A3Q8Q959_9VIRU|nr:hypothetical protein HOU84_gp15 [Sulfolobales Beppu filamentous virus 2]AZI75782.1 hypothetical protein SBFV2_gp15 [Sulfolobales Beppu filamentous virus 2]
MKLSDHELRFALVLYPFSVILAKYSIIPKLGVNPLIVLTAFALWIIYENYFAWRQHISVASLISVNVIGTANAISLWWGNLTAIYVTTGLLIGEGIILNILGLTNCS